MQLVTIKDLARGEANIRAVFAQIAALRERYIEHVEQDDSGTEYTVCIEATGRRSGGIHASESSWCERKVVYSLCGTKRKHNPRAGQMRRRFQMGHAVHPMIQNDFRAIAARSGGRLRFDAEVPVSPELEGLARLWEIRSRCDGVFTFCNRRLRPIAKVGLEIKGVSDGEFAKLRQPAPEHREQGTIYQVALDLPLMWTLYYNKSNSNISTASPPFVQEFDASLWHELEERFRRAHKHRDQRTFPERQDGFHCGWCDFAWKCRPPYLERPRHPRRGLSLFGNQERRGRRPAV